MIYQNITELIGNTPMLLISKKIHKIPNITLYCKLEYYNPFWSIKDRMARSMLKFVIDDMSKHKCNIIESSSGNTIKALQSIANIYWIQGFSLTNRISVKTKKHILAYMWTKLLSPKKNAQFKDIQHTIEMFRKKKIWSVLHTSQYTNNHNQYIHYTTTAEEIYKDIWNVDFIVWGLWTAWSLSGTSMKLKYYNDLLKTLWVCASNGDIIPWLRTLKQMQDVKLFNPNHYDDIMEVSLRNAIKSQLMLMKSTGIMWWISTGAAYYAIKKYFKTHPVHEHSTVVFFASDRIEPYIDYLTKKCKLYNINLVK